MALVSIIFSFRNEELCLPHLFDRLEQVMAGQPEKFELIFVDDCSTDKSAEIIRSRACDRYRIKLVEMSRRWGVEECFLAGLEQAEGDAVVMMYTDLQDPPETLIEMLAKWREGADVVHTIRRQRIGEKQSKIIAAWFAYRLINFLSDIEIPTDAGEFKLLSRRVADQLKALGERDPYLRGLVPWIGFKQAYVEYDMQPRPYGESKIPLFGNKAQSVLINGLVSFSDKPIRLMFKLGLAAAAVSVPWLLLTLLLGGGALAALFPFLTLLFGISVGALAVVGMYTVRSYNETRGRPRWICERVETLGALPE